MLKSLIFYTNGFIYMLPAKRIAKFIGLITLLIITSVLLMLPFKFIIHLTITIICLAIAISLATLMYLRDMLFTQRPMDRRIKMRLENAGAHLYESIASTLELRSLLFSIITIISSNLRLSGASIFLLDKDYNNYILKESFKLKSKNEQKSISWQHALYIYLVTHKNIITNNDAFAENPDPHYQNNAVISMLNEQNAAYCLPIFHQDELTAIIFLGSRANKEKLIPAELDFLKGLIHKLGTPIFNAGIHYETQKKVEELNSLYEVGKVINSSFELNKTIALIASNASILLKAPKIIISLRNDLQKPFEIKKIVGLNEDQIAYLNNNREITDLLTIKLAKDKIPLLIEDTTKSTFFTPEYIRALGIGSVVAIPLFDNELNVVGELRLMRSPSQQIFNQRELLTAGGLAGNVTIALRNAKLYSELSTVYNLDQTINSLFDVNKIQEKIVSILEKEFSFKRVLIFVYDKKNSKLVASYGKGWEKKIYQELDINIYKTIIGRSIIENRMITVENAPKDPRVSPHLTSFLNLNSFICIPLITPGKTVGSIIADFDQEPFSQHQLNMSLLQNTANISSMALANCLLYYESEKLNESLTREQAKTHKELQIARYIQQGLLSTKLPDNQRISISTRNIPCRSVGGDFFNFIRYNDNQLGFVIGDVSGKGIPAALIMTLSSGIFSEVGFYSTSPQQVLIKANNSLREYLKEIPVFYVTAFYGVFDLENMLFTYSKAGHNPPIYYNKTNGEITYLDTEGTYLGTFEDCGFLEKTIPLNPGDKLVFYTDGITEARSPHRELFGREKLGSLIQKHSALTTTELEQKILEEINKFTQNAEQNDDLVLVICEINGTQAIAKNEVNQESCFFEVPSSTTFAKQTVTSILAAAAPYIKNQQHKFHLRLAITEALLNAIEHGNKNDINKIVRVEYILSKKMIEVKITDQGPGFNPESVIIPENTLESKGRGRGLLAVKACMDEIRFSDTGNTLTLIKYFT